MQDKPNKLDSQLILASNTRHPWLFPLNVTMILYFSSTRPPARQRRVPAQPQPDFRRGVHLHQQQLVQRRRDVARHGLLQEEGLYLRGLWGPHAAGKGAQPKRRAQKIGSRKIGLRLLGGLIHRLWLTLVKCNQRTKSTNINIWIKGHHSDNAADKKKGNRAWIFLICSLCCSNLTRKALG